MMTLPLFYHDPSPSVYEARIYVRGLEREVSLLHMADSHLSELGEADRERVETVMPMEEYARKAYRRLSVERFQETLNTALELRVDALMLTGDIASFPSAANLELIAEELGRCRLPYQFVYGNHDWHFKGLEKWNNQARSGAFPLFKSLTKGSPDFQTMRIAGVRCIAIDNSTYQVSRQQLHRLREELAAGEPCLLFMHIPLWLPELGRDVLRRWRAPILVGAPNSAEETSCRKAVPPPEPSTREFYELVTAGEAGQLAGIFCGHVHFAHKEAFREGRYQYVCHPGYDLGYRIIRLLPWDGSLPR